MPSACRRTTSALRPTSGSRPSVNTTSQSSTLGAITSYAHEVLTAASNRGAPGAEERVVAARRAAGVSLGEAEVSLERLLAEPLGDKEAAEDAMLLVTYARRLGSALTHQPTRQRERAMKRFTSVRHAQRFLSACSGISAHFRPRRHRLSATQWRTEIDERFAVWREVTALDAAA